MERIIEHNAADLISLIKYTSRWESNELSGTSIRRHKQRMEWALPRKWLRQFSRIPCFMTDQSRRFLSSVNCPPTDCSLWRGYFGSNAGSRHHLTDVYKLLAYETLTMNANHSAMKWLSLFLLFACACHGKKVPEGYQGIVEYDERHAAFELPGRIVAVDVKRGVKVVANEVLAKLDSKIEVNLRAIKVAELEAAKAHAELLRAGARPEEIRETKSQLKAAKATSAHLQKNLDRNRKLAKNGALASDVVENLEDGLSRARANESVLTQRLRIIRQGARGEEIKMADAQVDATTSALALEDQRLARYILHSPIDGRVLDVVRFSGEVVGMGATVVVLADTNHPHVDAFVPQDKTKGLRIGTDAKVNVDSIPESLVGHIENIARKTEFTPRFLFSEKERPNLVVRVRLRVEDPNEVLHAGIPAFVTFKREMSR